MKIATNTSACHWQVHGRAVHGHVLCVAIHVRDTPEQLIKWKSSLLRALDDILQSLVSI